jgi:hypothetical protein
VSRSPCANKGTRSRCFVRSWAVPRESVAGFRQLHAPGPADRVKVLTVSHQPETGNLQVPEVGTPLSVFEETENLLVRIGVRPMMGPASEEGHVGGAKRPPGHADHSMTEESSSGAESKGT